MPWELYAVIGLALIFDFPNGVHDSSNIVATMIASRAFRPGTALGLTAVANFLGPFLFGVAVATTIGDEVAQSSALSLEVIVACLVGAIVHGLHRSAAKRVTANNRRDYNTSRTGEQPSVDTKMIHVEFLEYSTNFAPPIDLHTIKKMVNHKYCLTNYQESATMPHSRYVLFSLNTKAGCLCPPLPSKRFCSSTSQLLPFATHVV